MGDAALDAPESIDALAAQADGYRSQIPIAEKAIAAAQPRLQTARLAVLEAEARECDDRAAQSRKRLEAHEAKTRSLLDQLAAHEGCAYVPERDVARIDHRGTTNSGASTRLARDEWGVPKTDSLKDAVAIEEMRADALRDVAAGVDPRIRLNAEAEFPGDKVFGLEQREFYPSSVWGPEAVIYAPAFLDTIASVARRLEDHDRRVEHGDRDDLEYWHRQIGELEIIAARERAQGGQAVEKHQAIAGRQAKIAEIEAWHRDAPKTREAILDELEVMTGAREVPEGVH